MLVSISYPNDDWKQEVDAIKQELALQRQLIETLQQGITVKTVVATPDGYSIQFTDASTIVIKDGSTPIITIGDNGNWFINGIDTRESSSGPDGENGQDGHTPTVTIIDGYCWIDGINTGVKAVGVGGMNGSNGQNGTIHLQLLLS